MQHPPKLRDLARWRLRGLLRRRLGMPRRQRRILALARPGLLQEQIALYREHPSLQACARLELVRRRQRPQGRFLHQIVGPAWIPHQEARIGSQVGQQSHQGSAQFVNIGHAPRSTTPSRTAQTPPAHTNTAHTNDTLNATLNKRDV